LCKFSIPGEVNDDAVKHHSWNEAQHEGNGHL